MWPFKNKTKYMVLKEEFDDAESSINRWYLVNVVAVVIFGVFASLFVGGFGLWTLVPSAIALLAFGQANSTIQQHKDTITRYYDQERETKLDRQINNDDKTESKFNLKNLKVRS